MSVEHVAGQHGRDLVFDKAKDLELAGKLTLDGKPAGLRGRLLVFPVVVDLTDPARSMPFAWATVQRVVNKGGNFKS